MYLSIPLCHFSFCISLKVRQRERKGDFEGRCRRVRPQSKVRINMDKPKEYWPLRKPPTALFNVPGLHFNGHIIPHFIKSSLPSLILASFHHFQLLLHLSASRYFSFIGDDIASIFAGGGGVDNPMIGLEPCRRCDTLTEDVSPDWGRAGERQPVLSI